MSFEYKVVPAPVRGKRTRGVRGVAGRFAAALERLMNEMAADGWEFHRADALPAEERVGLTQKQTTYQNVLIFRRALTAEVAPAQPDVTAEIQTAVTAALAQHPVQAPSAAKVVDLPNRPEGEPQKPYIVSGTDLEEDDPDAIIMSPALLARAGRQALN